MIFKRVRSPDGHNTGAGMATPKNAGPERARGKAPGHSGKGSHHHRPHPPPA